MEVKRIDNAFDFILTHIEEDIGGNFVVMSVTPVNSSVTIDNEPQEIDAEGKLTSLLSYGTHTYSVAANMHKTDMGTFTIDRENKKFLTVNLEPQFSYLQINTTPQGAEVYIDNSPTSAGVTPLKTGPIAYGKHTLQYRKSKYKDKYVEIEVATGGKTQNVSHSLDANFATVHLTVANNAEIYVNNEKKGVGSWSGELSSGNYLIEARKESHHSTKTTLNVQSGVPVNKTLEAPIPRYGTLQIESTPIGSTIVIDGKEMGTTPDILRNILIGDREVTIKKEGYETLTKTITIEEGKASAGNFALHKKPEHQPIAVTQPKENKTTTKDFTETINGLNLQMVYVEGGTFTMGATPEQGSDAEYAEKPAHKVTLSSYYIGKYEVTQAQWSAIMDSNPKGFITDNKPVVNVNWNKAQEFCKKLSALTGKKYRLPTEAEWEYAARGGNKSKGYKYSGSNTIDKVAWYCSNSGYKINSVGQKLPNELGIYDMSGNVYEWCNDWHGSYSSSPQTNPTGATSDYRRVYRGGSGDRIPRNCRVATRCNEEPNYSYLGLRLVCEIESNKTSKVSVADSNTNKVNKDISNEELLESVEQMPTYPGGLKALMQFIGNKLIYPDVARNKGEQGRVVARFVVKKDGTIGDVQILSGVSPELDQEAIRVIKSITGFIPGKQNGKPVNVWYTLPISFKLY